MENKNSEIPFLSARIEKLVDSGSTKAFASMNIGNAFAVHGIRVLETEKGLGVLPPSRSYKNSAGKTQYSDIFHAITTEAYKAMVGAVVDAYVKALEQERKQKESMEMKM